MADTAPRYTRLPGRGSAGFQRYRLWLGDGHLLQVASTAIGEHYKRFYFADIQAFVIRRTMRGLVWSIALVLLAALLGALTFTVDETGGKIGLASIAGLFLGLLVANLALGPTCSVTVRTAVQTEKIPSLARLRTARKVLARIRPLIEEQQQALAAAPVEHGREPAHAPTPDDQFAPPADAP